MALMREEQRQRSGVLVRKNFRVLLGKTSHLVQYWSKMVWDRCLCQHRLLCHINILRLHIWTILFNYTLYQPTLHDNLLKHTLAHPIHTFLSWLVVLTPRLPTELRLKSLNTSSNTHSNISSNTSSVHLLFRDPSDPPDYPQNYVSNLSIKPKTPISGPINIIWTNTKRYKCWITTEIDSNNDISKNLKSLSR